MSRASDVASRVGSDADRFDGALAVLAGLPLMTSFRLGLLLRHHEPVDALRRLATGRPLDQMFVRAVGDPGKLAAIRSAAAATSPASAIERCRDGGIAVLRKGDPGYPAQLVVDPQPPAVLFVRGDPRVLDARRVGIVGTRNASAAGRATAEELGRVLAEHAVTVISGLARGVDAAAHRGVRAVAGRAVGVVGNGLDTPYPKQNAELWDWVATNGLLISEWPPGTQPEGWRFPLRNRILAALCEVLVVVESRDRGGSLITARAALDRNVEVMAVPGSPRNRSAAGTNKLLVDGAAPVTSADDVLGMLGLDHRRQAELPFDPRPAPTAEQALVLSACIERPCTLDMIVAATGLSVTDAAIAAARLEQAGWLCEVAGWFEPAGSRFDGSRPEQR